MRRLRLREGVKAKSHSWLIGNASVRAQALVSQSGSLSGAVGVSVSSCKMGMSLEGPEREAWAAASDCYNWTFEGAGGGKEWGRSGKAWPLLPQLPWVGMWAHGDHRSLALLRTVLTREPCHPRACTPHRPGCSSWLLSPTEMLWGFSWKVSSWTGVAQRVLQQRPKGFQTPQVWRVAPLPSTGG